MKILAIETSCDETAVAILECSGDPRKNGVVFDIRASIVLSQVALHAEYGGVFPSLAKREHAKNLIPVLERALRESNFLKSKRKTQNAKLQLKNQKDIELIFEREPELLAQFLEFMPTIQTPPIDAIAVTYGPGLEPALWVGINFAKALAHVWSLPIIPVNHMEGHLVSALLQAETRISKSKFLISNKIQNSKFKIQKINFPILALLVSGGHTEIVLSRGWLHYEIIGETRDDAAGEAFDKVARMLGLGYPGGPAIAHEAAQWKSQITKPKSQTNSKFKILNSKFRLPRPMLDSDDFDFSFSGLKTAVLYALKGRELMPELVQEFAYEFQEAVTDVLVTKTVRAAQEYGARAVLLGGGVSANTRLQEALSEKIARELPDTAFMSAPRELTGDNAVMIGAAAYLRHTIAPREYLISEIRAEGTLRIGKKVIL